MTTADRAALLAEVVANVDACTALDAADRLRAIATVCDATDPPNLRARARLTIWADAITAATAPRPSRPLSLDPLPWHPPGTAMADANPDVTPRSCPPEVT